VQETEFAQLAHALPGSALVVTAAAGEDREGCLVGFATQASMNPPRILVCLSVQNATFETAKVATHLGVPVVPAGRRDLAELFGGETGDDVDKFVRCRWENGPGGEPLEHLYDRMKEVPWSDSVRWACCPLTGLLGFISARPSSQQESAWRISRSPRQPGRALVCITTPR